MRRISMFAAAVVLLAGLSSSVAAAGGRGGSSHGAASSTHSVPLVAPTRPGGSGAAAAGAVGPVGAPIGSTLAPLPGNDRVTSCVHASGMAGVSGTAQSGPFVHSCAFGQ